MPTIASSAECFGDHYARTGVDLPTRELLTLSMLVALGGCDPQGRGHIAANLHVGSDRARGGRRPRRPAGIIDSVDIDPAPLRMVLGSQALERTIVTLRTRLTGFETQTELAASTDYRQGE